MMNFVLALVGGFAAVGVCLWRIVILKGQLAESRANVRLLEERIQDRKENEELLRSAARTEIANVAGQLLERETKRFQEASEKNIEGLLNPLKERLKDFEKKVDETYQAEGRERFLLKSEVEKLITLNEKMTRETTQLTQALKGDSKVQGDWGEFVLENILTSSGLREGLEYSKQESFENSDGDRLRPDIIVRLPDEKQIVIDSKVSLKAYETMMRSESTEERALHLRAHCESLARHVDSLAEKHYSKVKGLRSPEFVFLFTPIESAYVVAIQSDPDLAARAWKKGVAIVTSTTLFTSLKTVASIWRLENQNRNAQEIADEAAKLYDKFVGFHDDFEKIGRIFETGSAQFDEARRKLRDGPGNVFRKIELLRELGAAPNKRIKPELLE
ncbi:MAG TPA: DNA recombination protein RmuC [Bdellovibrionales bacterium]|nr:DNA recombination protein RmuC [Bdellovibrionales bacterium]